MGDKEPGKFEMTVVVNGVPIKAQALGSDYVPPESFNDDLSFNITSLLSSEEDAAVHELAEALRAIEAEQVTCFSLARWYEVNARRLARHIVRCWEDAPAQAARFQKMFGTSDEAREAQLVDMKAMLGGEELYLASKAFLKES